MSKDNTELEFQLKDDPYRLIPEGEYRVGFVRCEKRKFYGGEKLYVWFQIYDEGEYHGVKIFRAYNFSQPLKRGDLRRDLTLLYGFKVRKNMKLSSKLFEDKVLRAKVRTVKLDRKQRLLPEHEWYSVVDQIIKIEVGGKR